jgi:NAD(P)-dependent dehydrogenase (short-subunit alcohol dehydrogenase family)
MAGRVVVLTGASSGIGAAAAIELGRLGATVVPVGRSAQRLGAVGKQLEAVGGTAADPEVVDLSSLQEVRALAQRLLVRHARIDVLVNNAGTVAGRRALTPEGYGRTFAVNHLAPFLLSNLLLDRLRLSAPARVLTTASVEHRKGSIDPETLAQDQRSWAPMRAYRNSKLANVLFTRELARRLQGSGVVANCLHPGGVRTELGRELPLVMRLGWKLMSRSFATPQEGARTLVYLASAREAGEVSGEYFANCRRARVSSQASDPTLARALWHESEQLVGLATRFQPASAPRQQ